MFNGAVHGIIYQWNCFWQQRKQHPCPRPPLLRCSYQVNNSKLTYSISLHPHSAYSHFYCLSRITRTKYLQKYPKKNLPKLFLHYLFGTGWAANVKITNNIFFQLYFPASLANSPYPVVLITSSFCIKAIKKCTAWSKNDVTLK